MNHALKLMKLVSLIVLLGFALQCRSQLDFSAGVQTGFSMSQISGDGLGGFDKFGLSAGPFVRAKWTKTSSAKVEILYINKGSRKNANPKINDFRTYVLSLNYVEVPLLYNYSYGDKLVGEAGVAIGTLLSSKQRDNDLEIGFSRPFKSTEFSMVFGANYKFNEKLFFNARYTNSIIPVRNAPENGNGFSFYEAGQYNSLLQFMLGYEF